MRVLLFLTILLFFLVVGVPARQGIIKRRQNQLQRSQKHRKKELHQRNNERENMKFSFPLSTDTLCDELLDTDHYATGDYCDKKYKSWEVYKIAATAKCKFFQDKLTEALLKNKVACTGADGLYIASDAGKKRERRDIATFGIEYEIHNAYLKVNGGSAVPVYSDSVASSAKDEETDIPYLAATVDDHYNDDESAHWPIFEMASAPLPIDDYWTESVAKKMKAFQDLVTADVTNAPATVLAQALYTKFNDLDAIRDKASWHLVTETHFGDADKDFTNLQVAPPTVNWGGDTTEYIQVNYDMPLSVLGDAARDDFLTIGTEGNGPASKAINTYLKVCRKAASDYIAAAAVLKDEGAPVKCILQGVFTLFYYNVMLSKAITDHGGHGKNRFNQLVKSSIRTIAPLLEGDSSTAMTNWHASGTVAARSSAMLARFKTVHDSALGADMRAVFNNMDVTHPAKLEPWVTCLEPASNCPKQGAEREVNGKPLNAFVFSDGKIGITVESRGSSRVRALIDADDTVGQELRTMNANAPC